MFTVTEQNGSPDQVQYFTDGDQTISEEASIESCLDPAKNDLKNIQTKFSAIRHAQSSYYARALRDFSLPNSFPMKLNLWKKFASLLRLQDRVDCSEWETELLERFSEYMKQVERELISHDLRLLHLLNENEWLTDQERTLKERFQKLENQIRISEAERDVQKFTYKLRQSNINDEIIKYNIVNFDLEDDFCLKEMLSVKMQSMYQLILRYIKEGRTDVAGVLCMQVLRSEEIAGDSEIVERAIITFLLGVIYRHSGRIVEAIEKTEDALEILKARISESHPSLSMLHALLAECMTEAENYPKAVHHLKQAIKLKQNSTSKNNPEVIKLRVNLCKALLCMNLNEEVTQECNHLLSKWMQRYPAEDPMLIKIRLLLAQAYLNLKQPEKAYTQCSILLAASSESEGQHFLDLLESPETPQHEELCAIYKQLDSTHLARTLDILGSVYRAMGKFKVFERLSLIHSNGQER